MPNLLRLVTCCSIILGAVAVPAEEPVNLNVVNKIRYEGFKRSEVMDTFKHLTDVIGSRLTGSPGMAQANQWTRDTMASWGLINATVEAWGEFGRGWSYSRVVVDMLLPRQTSLHAIPIAWAPGTQGPVEGDVMRVEISEEDDFEEYTGTLAGKILLMDEPRALPVDITMPDNNALAWDIYSESVIPEEKDDERSEERQKRQKFHRALRVFLGEEDVLATVRISDFDYGVLEADGSPIYSENDPMLPPSVSLASNHYNQIARLLEKDETVRLRIDIEAQFHDADRNGYNTVAEIPGHGPKGDELVLLGAHLDSVHSGTGATDNAAGSAVVMEAMRILKEIGVRPRRTIRVILWSGEEQGLLGSMAYVENHFATRPIVEDSDADEAMALPPYRRERGWPITPLPDHAKVSVYFNLDTGGGKILGVYGEDNAAAIPIFEAWFKPFHDLSVDQIVLMHTTSTDHTSFEEVGLPAFTLVQDLRDYISRTHHTNLDVPDAVRREDLMQGAVVLASLIYHAAMRDELMPRKPLPVQPPEQQDEDEIEDDESA